jgi:hypothetical protein
MASVAREDLEALKKRKFKLIYVLGIFKFFKK